MSEQDIRWIQRFTNFNKALKKLGEAIHYIRHHYPDEGRPDEKEKPDFISNELMKQGLIQSFEYTHELAWSIMKDYAFFQGNPDIGGSRDATREALQLKIIKDGHVWMEMIASRNKTSHTYNEETANEIFSKIIQAYYPAFIAFQETMEEKRNS